MEKNIWTPRLYGSCDFGIDLDRDFAIQMIKSHASTDRQKRMNELASEELKRFRINISNPYDFHAESCFISEIYLGHNGVLISTNHHTIEELLNGVETSKPVIYNSHNVDTPTHAYVIMVLFNKWIDYSEVLREES